MLFTTCTTTALFENSSDEVRTMDNGSKGTCNDAMKSSFDSYLKAQIQEIERYKWCLGVQLKRDPLMDRSYDDICLEWISRHAADFRKHWNN